MGCLTRHGVAVSVDLTALSIQFFGSLIAQRRGRDEVERLLKLACPPRPADRRLYPWDLRLSVSRIPTPGGRYTPATFVPRKNHGPWEYARAGMDNVLFVFRYQPELPRKEKLGKLLEAELTQRGAGEADT